MASPTLEPTAPAPSPVDAETPLKAAIAHLAQGKTQAALQAASDACHAAPKMPATHYAHGRAWSALGRHDDAERAFAAAIQLKPDWAEAWVHCGVARYRQGAIEDAKTAMRQALRHAPDHSAALANLGAFPRITGEPAAAEALLRQTLARERHNAGARLNLAADLLQEERPAEALCLLDESHFPAADARAARHWLLRQSLALLQLGRAGEARATLEKLASLGPPPPEIAPLWLWRLVLLAQVEGDFSRARASAGQMEQALDIVGDKAAPEHRIMAHYDLAKFWSGQNEHPRAFQHWASGHRLPSRSQPFSREKHLAFVEANIALLDRPRFENAARAQNRDPAPVLIVGMPRSGTTLIEQILFAHAQARGAGERSALDRRAKCIGAIKFQRSPEFGMAI